MAKLSAPMIDALRKVRDGRGEFAHARTRAALRTRLLIEWDISDGWLLTQEGRDALAAIDPDPAGPAVRLTTMRSSSAPPEATDAEVLQLLAVLDAGGSVHRALYQEWGVLDAGPFRLNLDAVNRAARDAARFGLARQTFANHEYTLTAEPIHLDAGNGHSVCGFPLAGYTIRHRVTSDPAKVTHERCKPDPGATRCPECRQRADRNHKMDCSRR